MHFLINIGMTIGLVPVIGIPLPFISYGGSSLVGFTILLFIFLNLDSYRLQDLEVKKMPSFSAEHLLLFVFFLVEV